MKSSKNQLIIWAEKKKVLQKLPLLYTIFVIPAKYMFVLRGRPWLMTRV
jgi:hypothetical protein